MFEVTLHNHAKIGLHPIGQSVMFDKISNYEIDSDVRRMERLKCSNMIQCNIIFIFCNY